jgi:hypothetical protein
LVDVFNALVELFFVKVPLDAAGEFLGADEGSVDATEFAVEAPLVHFFCRLIKDLFHRFILVVGFTRHMPVHILVRRVDDTLHEEVLLTRLGNVDDARDAVSDDCLRVDYCHLSLVLVRNDLLGEVIGTDSAPIDY